MRLSRQGRFRQQVAFVRRQFLQEGQLPFTSVRAWVSANLAVICGESRLLRRSSIKLPFASYFCQYLAFRSSPFLPLNDSKVCRYSLSRRVVA